MRKITQIKNMSFCIFMNSKIYCTFIQKRVTKMLLEGTCIILPLNGIVLWTKVVNNKAQIIKAYDLGRITVFIYLELHKVINTIRIWRN